MVTDTNTNTNKFLIADDHSVVRIGLKTIIKDIFPFAVFDEAINGLQVVRLMENSEYDLLILDINMPDTDPVWMISTLFAAHPSIKVLIFSMNPELLYAQKFMNMGVLGYLDKESGAAEIRTAIRTVLLGQRYVNPSLKDRLGVDVNNDKGHNPFDQLSGREMQIVCYLLYGRTLTEIHKELNLSISTVGTYKTRLFEKLGIGSLSELRELANLYQMDPSKIQK